jgi:hypothetical protein
MQGRVFMETQQLLGIHFCWERASYQPHWQQQQQAGRLFALDT